MAGLPHWDNSRAATNYYEPVFLNQFEVVITPPASITDNVDLLVEHVMEIKGLPELTAPETVTQTYKFAKRSYSGAIPKETIADLGIKFSVNLNEENNMYIYNILRGWFDLAYDPLTGRQGLKKDYYGQIYVAVFNKAGDIFREFRFTPCIPNGGLTPMDLNYTANGLYEVTATFRADAWKETRIGEIRV
jgi:hypothetical protein